MSKVIGDIVQRDVPVMRRSQPQVGTLHSAQLADRPHDQLADLLVDQLVDRHHDQHVDQLADLRDVAQNRIDHAFSLPHSVEKHTLAVLCMAMRLVGYGARHAWIPEVTTCLRNGDIAVKTVNPCQLPPHRSQSSPTRMLVGFWNSLTRSERRKNCYP